MRLIFVARDPTEAHLIKGLLEARGIQAAVRGDDVWGDRDDSGLSRQPPTVLILNEELEAEARGVLAAYEAAAASSVGGTWLCPECREEVELQFGTCWRCGTERVDRQ